MLGAKSDSYELCDGIVCLKIRQSQLFVFFYLSLNLRDLIMEVWVMQPQYPHLSASSRMMILCRPLGSVTFCWANILILFLTTSMPLQRQQQLSPCLLVDMLLVKTRSLACHWRHSAPTQRPSWRLPAELGPNTGCWWSSRCLEDLGDTQQRGWRQ